MYSYFVGIDIAKNTHWASCLSSDGEIILEPFSFSNDNSGFQKFSNDNSGFQKFISKLESLDKTKILIGLESTAHYGENIISYLFNLDFNIGLTKISFLTYLILTIILDLLIQFRPLIFVGLISEKLRMIKLTPK